jgi:hypothetical protein
MSNVYAEPWNNYIPLNTSTDLVSIGGTIKEKGEKMNIYKLYVTTEEGKVLVDGQTITARGSDEAYLKAGAFMSKEKISRVKHSVLLTLIS